MTNLLRRAFFVITVEKMDARRVARRSLYGILFGAAFTLVLLALLQPTILVAVLLAAAAMYVIGWTIEKAIRKYPGQLPWVEQLFGISEEQGDE